MKNENYDKTKQEVASLAEENAKQTADFIKILLQEDKKEKDQKRQE